MRKVLSTLLVLAMALTVFWGAAFAAEFNDMGVFPVVKDGEGIKLTVATPEVATITDYDNNHLTNYLRERMGIEIEVQLFDNAEYKTQLQLMTSSGARLPDLLLNFNLTPTEREFYGRQGYFIDLRPYFEEGVMTRYFEGEAGQLSDGGRKGDHHFRRPVLQRRAVRLPLLGGIRRRPVVGRPSDQQYLLRSAGHGYPHHHRRVL